MNPNLLLLSRLDFLTKHKKIHNYIKRQYHRRKQEIDVAQNYFRGDSKAWHARIEVARIAVDKQLKYKHPKIYEDLEFEPKKPVVAVPQFMGLGSGKNRALKQQIEEEEEEWDDFQRYRDNKAQLSNSIFCLYHRSDQAVQPIVYFQSAPKPITDPFYYESEHKKRNVWSIREIEHFLQFLLENPRNFWAVGKLMPHRTSKDLVFFFYAFKKLFNLKKHFKTCQVLMTLPTQAVKKQAIQDIINEIMKPIKSHQSAFNSKAVIPWDINIAVARASGGHNQQYFTIEELLEIYTA